MAAERPFAVPTAAAGAPPGSGSAAHAGTIRCAALLTWSREFPGTAAQAGRARRFLAGVLAGSPLTDDAVLCLSELASNAIGHSGSGRPGGTFTVRVSAGAGRVRLEVADAGGPWPDPPRPSGHPAAPLHAADGHPTRHHHRDRGRGLAVVAALATAWGIAGGDAGRVAWCEFELPVAGQRRRSFAQSDIPH